MAGPSWQPQLPQPRQGCAPSSRARLQGRHNTCMSPGQSRPWLAASGGRRASCAQRKQSQSLHRAATERAGVRHAALRAAAGRARPIRNSQPGRTLQLGCTLLAGGQQRLEARQLTRGLPAWQRWGAPRALCCNAPAALPAQRAAAGGTAHTGHRVRGWCQACRLEAPCRSCLSWAETGALVVVVAEHRQQACFLGQAHGATRKAALLARCREAASWAAAQAVRRLCST